ncbi:MAG: SsrA-binding protein SmpB [Candidatus Paraimprobicoccus trichonymphae]|uniref:SsrA-binding protein n=1 Tax=Candidatus Paraimprobicoccus trichonymphae TaxID=3033793 RepID=A0AA48I414_9FIRM|nr:MAG: SsrA-binding protein SmpB [Candidatus Paraimprobicoccus trichonymphae]
MSDRNSIITISNNRKAYHEYFVLESLETGIVLFGTEVKSLRKYSVNLKDAWCSVVKSELFVNNMHIGIYEQGNIFNKEPLRVRKLLAHKKEILKLFDSTKQKGFSLIPLSLYFKNSNVKIQVGLCKGKKIYDKRRVLAERSAQRDIQRDLKENYRY